MTVVFSTFVPGTPKSQGSKKYVGHRGGKAVLAESSKGNKAWRNHVAGHVAEAWSNVSGPLPKAKAWHCTLLFYLQRPKSVPRHKRPEPTVYPDLDKLIRSVDDALTGVLFEDDSSIVSISARKSYADEGQPPGVHISVAAVPQESGR